MDTPNRKENIAKLLGFLKQNGYASKGLSLEGLDTRLQNDSLRRNLYNALSRDKVPDIGSWDEFSSMVKKEKDSTALAQPSTKATSTPLVPNSPLLPSPNKTSKNTLSTDWTRPTPQFSIPTSERNPGVPTLVPSREHPYVGRELAFVSPSEVTNLNTGKKHYDASKTSVIYPDEIGEDNTRKAIDNYTQAKASEANRLDRKIEAQLQDIEKQQKELEARLNKRAKELEAEREGEGWFVNFIRSQPARGMDPMSTINRLTNDGKDQDEEYIGISSALHNLRKQKEKLLATKKSMQEDASFGSFLTNAGRGFVDTVTDTRIWDGGEGDLREAGLAIKAIGKLELQKKFNSGQATKEDAELLRTLYKGQLKLTPAEDALLNSKAGRAYVDAITKEAIGYGYGAGETTANMLPFIRDIALSPVNGLGRTVATNVAKSALKSGLSRVATKAISRTARVVGDIALEGAGTALTTGIGGTLKGAADEQIGDIKYDVDGKTGQIVYGGRTNQEENFLKAFGKSLVRQALEYGTEATGGAYIGTLMKPINKYGGKLLTKTLGDKAVSAVEKFFARMEKTSVGKAVNSVGEQVHYDGLPGEYLEEVYNNLLNAITIGDMKLDTNSNNGVFNPEINKTIIIGLMGAPMATVSLKVGSIVAQDTKTQAMGLRAFGYKQWQEMKTLIGNSDDVSKTISEWAEQNPNATSNQKKAIMRYAVATAMEDAMTVRQALEQKERKKDSATTLTPSQTAEQSGEESAVAPNPPSSSTASESADNTFNPNSDNSKRYEQGNGVILKREDGTSVRAQIVSEENEDGKIEVASSEGAIQGRDRVVYLTRKELDQMYQGSFDIDTPDASSNEETQLSDTSIDSTPASPTPNSDSPIGRPMTEEEAVSDTPHSEESSEEHEWDELSKQVGDESAREIISSDISDLEAERKKLQKEISKPKGQTREEKIQYVIGRRERLQGIDAEIEGLQRVLQVPQMRIAQAEAQEREQNRIKAEEARRQEEADEQARAEKKRQEAERLEEERLRQEKLQGVPDWVDDTPQNARARGYRRSNGESYDRQERISNGVSGNEVQVKFSNEDMPTGRIMVIEADELQPSHIQGQRNPNFFIDEAQPKDRIDDASVLSARRIAGNMRPEEITGNATAYTGAPIVNSRGEVIQGNNRSDALRYMYQHEQEQAQKYKQHLLDNAERLGLSKDAIMQMNKPVLVTTLEVSDNDAIRLGQMSASDTESGGVERIKPMQTITKMGDNIQSFSRILLSGDEDMDLSSVVDHNGADALKWMHSKGYITDTQYQSAFKAKGELTGEAKNDLINILSEVLFNGAGQQLRDDFEKLPAKAKKAILATIYRDLNSPESERIIMEVQDSIRAYAILQSNSKDFSKAKNTETALRAIDDWLSQQVFDDVSGEIYIPNDRLHFSNFALHLAGVYRGATQAYTSSVFNALYDDIQGLTSDIFDDESGKKHTLTEAIKRQLNIDYNGKTTSSDVAHASQNGSQRERGSSSDYKERNGTEGTSEPSRTGGRSQTDSRAVESEYSVSTSPAEKGGNFIQNKEGSIDLVQIKQEVFDALGIPAVPFRMTESMAQHVLEQHSQELKITSIEEAVAFVLNVMQNFDHVRKGDLPNTYIFSIENARRKVGKRAVTLVLPSSNGDYLGVSSSGNEDIKGIQKRELLWEEGAKNITPATETASANVPSPSATQGGMTGGSAKSNQSNSLSEDKDSEKSSSRFRPLTEDDLDDGVSIVYHKGKERVVVAVVGSSVVLDGGEKVAIGDLQVEDEANTSAEEIEETSEANSGEFGLVSDARMEELKSRLKKKLLGQVNAGVDPEVLAIGLELAVGYLDRGIRKFSEFAKVLVSDLGDDVRPYLKAFYNGARDMPQIVENGLDAQMDSVDTVRSFDVTNFDKAKRAGILDEAKTVAKNQAAERTLQKQSIGNDVAQAMEKRQQEENASEAEQAETKSKSKSKETGHGREEDVHVRTSPSPRKRTRGQQSRQNEPLGATAGNQAEQPDEVRVAGRDREDTSTDPLRSGRVSELPTEQIAETDGSAPQDAPKPTKSKAQNTHNWREDKGESTAPKTETERVNANIEALRLSKQIQEEGREATKAEQAVLARWTGWGGLGLAFAHNSRYRSELSTLLSPEEFESATASRLSAYYTPAKVIDHLWELIRELGFKGGNILEGSAGSGAILARMPKSISDKSNIQAVEIDSITGSILSQLYPDATVYVQGFEKTKIAPNSIHLAITNVPFITGLQVHDNTGNSDLSRKFKNIRDFCIAKNVRALTPSGIGVFISSNGTLDDSRDLRLWLDDPNGGNVDVLGAFRLNNETFIGAPVTSDIIVVRKRVGNTKVQSAINIIDTGFGHSISYQEAEATKPTTYTMSYNAYYMAHPEHMGGEMHFGFEQGATYRATSRGLYPTEDINQDARLADWVKSFKGMSYVGKQLAEQAEQQKTLESDESVEKGANLGDIMIAKDGTIGVVSYSDTSGKLIFENLGLNSNKVKGHSKQEVISDYIRLKKAVQDTISYQANSSSDTRLEELHQELNEAYDTFVERYGHLNKNVSLSFLKNDVGFPDIQAIEKYEEKGDVKGNKIKLYSKTDIFHKRIISHKQVEKPKDATHAVRSSILSFGRVDLAYIADVLSLSEEEARAEALKSGLAFEDPSTGKVVSRFEYLSGNVRAKLRDAEAQNEGGKYTDNINALHSVIPQDIPAHLLPYALGATWIPKRLFEDYIKERTDVSVTLSLYGGTWVLTAKSYDSTPKNRTFGVYSEMLGKTILGTEIIDTALNLRTKRVTKTFSSGYGSDKTKETLTDAIATASIADKIDEIKGDFVDWMQEQVQSDTELADELTRLYNEQMNNYVAQSMPDDFVPKRFEGASEAITLRPHQAKAAIRSTTQPVLLAHEVGTGKTYTMISAAMEMRRLGTAKKPLIVVQNATVGQFVASAKAIYPQAKILTLNETDKGEAGRRRFYAQIMYNDWDMIIIPQSVFDRIPDNEQRQVAYVADKIEEKRETLERMELNQELIRSNEYRAKKNELKRLEEELSSFAPSPIDEKRAEKARMNAVAKAERMLDRAVDDTTYDFDNLGIDAILVDEAHEYKHLGFETSMGSDIKGVDPSYSKKSQGLYLKVQSVLEKSGGRNVLFATGTPISNTAAEIWTFMRYLMPKEDMRLYGIYTFDDFVRNYGRVQTQLEFSTSGKFKAQKRFVGYDGLSELVRIWSQVADTVLTSNSPEVQEKLPGIEGGKATDIFLPQTAGLRAVMKYVVSELKRFEEMSGREKKENSHIPLTMYGIANAAAIDPRLVDGSAQDDPNTKANETVRQTLRSLKETESYKGTVAIFSDKYRNNVTGFNLYEDIRDKLIAEGVPEHQIAIVSGSMSQAKKLQIFDKINSGEIRVVLGSTATLGTGVNIQERLHTLIHIDAPNRPMDYTQRNGRILRQGNLHKDMNKPVRILRFGVDDSLDVTAYQRLKTKGAIADSIMHGEELMANALENRSIEDEGDNFGDMVATLSGSEYALLKNQAEKDLRKLESKRKQWEADQRYIASNLPKSEMLLNNAQVALARAKTAGVKIAQAFPDKAIGSIKIGKKKYGSISELKDFIKDYNASITEAQEKVKDNIINDATETRELSFSVNGIDFTLHTTVSSSYNRVGGAMVKSSSRQMTLSSEALGLEDVGVPYALIANAFKFIEEELASGTYAEKKQTEAEQSVERTTKEIEQMRSREGQEFAQQEELEAKRVLLQEYEIKMQEELEAKEAKYAQMDAEVETAHLDGEMLSDELDAEDTEGIRYRRGQELQEVNARFNEELQAQIDGTLPKGHVYSLGMPSDILRSAGIPNLPIELTASRVSLKSGQEKHPFPIKILSNLPQMLQKPIAVFHYGDKAMNVIVEIEYEGRDLLVGLVLNQDRNGIEVNDVRGLFPKDTAKWLNWITQGKAIYLNKEIIQTKITQQRTNLAEVGHLNLDDLAKVIKEFENPNIEGNAFDDDILFRGRYVEFQSGYTERADGTPISDNAKYAEEAGKFPASLFKKKYGISPADFNMLNDLGLIEISEWHHTGATFRETDYYSWVDNATFDDGYNSRQGYDINGEYEYNEQGEATYVGEDENPSMPLSEWYKQNKKAIKPIADAYKAGEWTWEREDPSVGLHRIKNREDAERRMIETHFRKEERQYRNIHWGEYPQSLKNLFSTMLKWDENAHYEDIEAEAERLANEFYDAHIEETLEADRKNIEEGEAKNRAIREKNLSSASKETALMALAKLYGMDEQEAYKKISSSSWYNRNSLRRRSTSSDEASEHNPLHAEMEREATSLAHSMGEEVVVVHNEEELVDILGEDGARQARGAKGFYLPKSGKVVIILSNNTDVADVLETIFHEFVGHKGLLEYVGKEEFTAFIDRVHKGLPSKALSEVHREARTIYNERKGTSRAVSYQDAIREATEEYIARVSEKGFSDRESRSTWQKIVDAFRDMISRAKLTLGWNIQDRDIRYILWKSFQMKQKQVAILAEAGDIAMRHRLGIPQRTKVSAEGARLRANKPTSLDEANKQFNEQLKKLNEETANSTILSLGSPSNVLLSAGVADKPMRLYGNKVIKKMKKHGFSLSELRDLPRAVANPIAVFNNYGKDGSRSILTELQTEQGNFLVAIGLGNGTDVEFNIVRSAFGKGKEQVVDWFNSSYATYINKEKALEYLRTPTLIMGAISNQELSSATKVIKEFENPSDESANGIRYRQSGGRQSSWHDSGAQDEYNERTRITDRNGKNKGKWTNNLWWRFKEAHEDAMLSLKELQDALAKNALGRDLHGFEDAYTAENAMSSKNLSEMEHYENRYVKPLTDALGKLIKGGVSYEEIRVYMMAKHGLERNAYYNQLDGNSEARDYSGLTALTESEDDFTQIAEQMVADFESRHDTSELWNAVRSANERTLSLSRQKNLISKQAYDHIKGMFEYYIPLRGWDENNAEDEWEYLDGAGRNGGISIRKKASGRTSLADDPIAMMVKLAEDTIRQGNRNMMKLKLLNLAENAQDSLLQHSKAWFVQETDAYGNTTWVFSSPEIAEDASPEEVALAWSDFEAKMQDLQKQGRSTQNPPKEQRKRIDFDKNGSLGERRQHTVTVYRGGQMYTVFVNGNPRAAQAVNGMLSSEEGFKWWRAFNRWLSTMHTSYNPEFIMTNAIRDIMHATAVVYAENGFGSYLGNFSKQYVKGMKDMFGLYGRWRSGTLDLNREKDKLFHDFMVGGGQTGYTQISKVEDLKKSLEWELKKVAGQANWARRGLEILKNAIAYFNSVVELNTRFATFVASRKDGRSIESSVSDAKNITVNFNRKGTGNGYGAGFARLAYLFYNPAVQALSQFYGLTKKHPRRMLGVIGGAMAIGLLQNLFWSLLGSLGDGGDGDDDDYGNINENSRLGSLIIHNPFSKDKYLNLPISPELKPFFTLGSAISEVIGGRMSEEEAAKHVVLGLSSLLPLDPAGGNNGAEYINLVPSAGQPLVQVVANKNYYGEQLYKDNGFNKLDPEWTKSKDANPALKGVAKMLNELSGGDKVRKGGIDLNPETIEHILESYSGGAGRAFNAFTKTVAMPFDPELQKASNVVMLRKLYKEVPQAKEGILNPIIWKISDQFKNMEHDKNGYRKELRSNDPSKVSEYIQKLYDLRLSSEYKFYIRYRRSIDRLQDLRKKYKEAKTDEERKSISDRMNSIQERVLKAYKEEQQTE